MNHLHLQYVSRELLVHHKGLGCRSTILFPRTRNLEEIVRQIDRSLDQVLHGNMIGFFAPIFPFHLSKTRLQTKHSSRLIFNFLSPRFYTT
nr:putative integron gene cassette protein [uncultured bacterium]